MLLVVRMLPPELSGGYLSSRRDTIFPRWICSFDILGSILDLILKRITTNFLVDDFSSIFALFENGDASRLIMEHFYAQMISKSPV